MLGRHGCFMDEGAEGVDGLRQGGFLDEILAWQSGSLQAWTDAEEVELVLACFPLEAVFIGGGVHECCKGRIVVTGHGAINEDAAFVSIDGGMAGSK